jgi:hypothetical protein
MAAIALCRSGGVSMFWAALSGALAALLVGADGIEPPTFAL